MRYPKYNFPVFAVQGGGIARTYPNTEAAPCYLEVPDHMPKPEYQWQQVEVPEELRHTMTPVHPHVKALGWSQFPVGTVCEAQFDFAYKGREKNEPFQVTVTGLIKNGADSYCIRTTEYCDLVEGPWSFNIANVTRILKRGPGVATLQEYEQTLKWRTKEEADYLRGINQFYQFKSKNRYLATFTSQLVQRIALEYSLDEHLLDIQGLDSYLHGQGVFRTHNANFYWCMFSADKKRLRKLVKQNLNRFLKNHAKEAIEYDKWMSKMDDAEMDREERTANLDAVARVADDEGSCYDIEDLNLSWDTPDSLLTNFRVNEMPAYEAAIAQYSIIEPDVTLSIEDGSGRGNSYMKSLHVSDRSDLGEKGLSPFWTLLNKIQAEMAQGEKQ